MKYQKVREGIFRERPNRFIANVEVEGEVIKCHVKNTGRCRELLSNGVTVFLEESDNPNRKTPYDVISVIKGTRLINMDSQAPNKVVYEWVEEGNLYPEITFLKPEYKYGNSRIDLYLERKVKEETRRCLIEVKGVTLEENGIVRFPDAPTERGIKHIHELIKAVEEGYDAIIFFVIQMKGVTQFEPNCITQPEFAKALGLAQEKGVRILAYDCEVGEDTLKICDEVPVVLARH